MYGQIGNGSGSTSDIESPQRIGDSNTWNDIAGGELHTCGINNNELYCWGYNEYGSVGNGVPSYSNIETPQKISNSNSWSIIAAGGYQSCAIKNNDIYCWGENHSGQLGNDNLKDIDTPARIGFSNTWNSISAGVFHVCGIDDGKLYCWGADFSGALGNGSEVNNKNIPKQIGDSNLWSSVAVGSYHSCGINNGELYCWGSDTYGQLGNGSGSTGSIQSPQKIGSSNGWSHVILGDNYTCGIDSGELYCWGRDNYGQLGNGSGSTANIESPQKIGSLNNWTHISTGNAHTCGIESGELYCWGRDNFGQLGNGSGSSANVETPQKIGGSNTWSSISLGSFHTCGLNNSQLFCWGRDFYGQIGNGSGSTADIESPQQIGSSNNWSKISLGAGHTCGIDNNELYCWGADDRGQIGNGNGSTSNVESPQKVGSSNSWNYISTGTSITCGLDTNKLFCFGKNNYGQSGFSGNKDVPTIVIK